MRPPPPIGHNNPPDPLDDALAPFGDTITEAENWLDGRAVQTEAEMRAVDALLSEVKCAEKAVSAAKDSEAKPLHDAWKAALARYKPTLEDLDRIKRGLVAAVDAFKRKLAAERQEAERRARAEAEAKARAAAEAAGAADLSNIDAQREAARLQNEAEIAQMEAARASKAAHVKGLRTTTFYEVTDHRAALHWIAKNDRDAVTAFVDGYARRHHAAANIDGVRVWQEKVAV